MVESRVLIRYGRTDVNRGAVCTRALAVADVCQALLCVMCRPLYLMAGANDSRRRAQRPYVRRSGAKHDSGMAELWVLSLTAPPPQPRTRVARSIHPSVTTTCLCCRVACRYVRSTATSEPSGVATVWENAPNTLETAPHQSHN